MQFASEGQWGRGLYFAKEPAYSHCYATQADANGNDLEDDEFEFMLTGLRIGDVIEMDRDLSTAMRDACKALKTPPQVDSFRGIRAAAADGTDTAQGPPNVLTPHPQNRPLKYNTVRGYTQTDLRHRDGSWSKNTACPRSQVWIVYENGRACKCRAHSVLYSPADSHDRVEADIIMYCLRPAVPDSIYARRSQQEAHAVPKSRARRCGLRSPHRPEALGSGCAQTSDCSRLP
jgi:hypothetical protein